ncbi:MAG: dTDP-4-dehydrorhamnose 3,5-epimerase [Mucilaginibacter sp.]|nr:dTDP-4-dehydrorhamnose 3,5-epimerase [Mucilaginibacter sp.]
MTITDTLIPGAYILEPKVYHDSRGSFIETFNQKHFIEKGIDVNFVQDNQSVSHKNVVRGLHAQKGPFEQGKLVRVVKGAVIDIALDARVGSPAYGKHISIELTAKNNKQFYIPPGCLHGFVALEDDTIFSYKVTNYFDKQSETGLIWNDPELAIGWSIDQMQAIVSEKDQLLPDWKSFESPFVFDN